MLIMLQSALGSEFEQTQDQFAAVLPQEVLEYVESGDLARAQPATLAPRCRQRAFFAAATAALRARRCWCPELWRYALMHGDQQALAEFLPSVPALTSRLTAPVNTSMLRLPIQVNLISLANVQALTHAVLNLWQSSLFCCGIRPLTGLSHVDVL